MTRVFRIIRHDDADRAVALGYLLTGPLEAPHGAWSMLWEWVCCCGREPPKIERGAS